MKLYTASYRLWSQTRVGAPVCTSLTTPRWLPEAAAWPKLWPVTPRWAYFKAAPDDFRRAFRHQLHRATPKRIAERLAEISSEAGHPEALTLLCWEASGDPSSCHRGLFAEWWLESTGELIHELDPAPSNPRRTA